MVKHKGQTKPNGQLRFAALKRVSSERQDKKGESLHTQQKQLIENVSKLNGRIVRWYGGQEHATEGYEKEEVDRLISDAQKNIFNAVIVPDPDRWSRDNEKSKKGLRILRDNGIRFFTGSTEWDLFKPEHVLYLGMAAEIGEFQALNQKRKSLENRIERAKKGWPAAGSLPFGRTFDRKTMQWGVNEKQKAMIEDIAERYIAGERMKVLADKEGMNHSVLHQILTKRCGDIWIQSFNSDNLNIHKTVKTKVPRLLPEATIKKVQERAQANKTYSHRGNKYKYLLNRMTFCGHCGSSFGAQTSGGKYVYFRHFNDKLMKNRKCDRPAGCNQVNGKMLEDMVIQHLYEMFGDPLTVQKAIEAATPNRKKVEQERQRLERLDKELQKIKQGRDRILRLIVKEHLTEAQAGTQLTTLKSREVKLIEERDRLCDDLAHLPNLKDVRRFAKRFKNRSVAVGSAKRRSKSKTWLKRMKYEDKRALVEMVFGGKMLDGRRMGVYIEWKDKKHWSFNIHGHLIDKQNLIPLSESERKARLEDESRDIGSNQNDFLSSLARRCPPTLQRMGMPPGRVF